MKFVKYILATLALLPMTSCINYIDNYDEPNAAIEGVIKDKETGENIPLNVEGSNGLIIRLTEIYPMEATNSNDFRAKLDGTFTNRMLFNGTYKITTVDGPFLEQPEKEIKLNGDTKVTLEATPYTRIKIESATANGRVFTIKYTVTKSEDDLNVTDVYGFWNWNSRVGDGGANQAGWQALKDADGAPQLSGEAVFDLTDNGAINDNLHMIQANGSKLFFRIAAKVNNRLNYSTVAEVKLP